MNDKKFKKILEWIASRMFRWIVYQMSTSHLTKERFIRRYNLIQNWNYLISRLGFCEAFFSLAAFLTRLHRPLVLTFVTSESQLNDVKLHKVYRKRSSRQLLKDSLHSRLSVSADTPTVVDERRNFSVELSSVGLTTTSKGLSPRWDCEPTRARIAST